MVAPAVAPRSDEDLPEVEVFVPGPDGEPIEFPGPTTPQELLRELSSSLSHGLDQLKEVHATSGQRLGTAERARRNGSREDVITPLLIRPAVALAAVLEGTLFAMPMKGVQVDEGSGEVEGRGISWQVTIATRWHKRRSGTLRIYSSPSANLTVLELIPNKPRLIWTWAFVSTGVAALDELGRRLTGLSRKQESGSVGSVGP